MSVCWLFACLRWRFPPTHSECLSAWASVRPTTVLLRCAPTATTGITRMVAPPTATTALITLLMESLLARAPGITATTGAVYTVAVMAAGFYVRGHFGGGVD